MAFFFPSYVWEVLNKRIPRRTNNKHREDGDFILVYNLSVLGRSLLSLNNTAAAIYRLCDGKHTIADMIHAFQTEYPDVSEETLTCDVHTCIRTMEFKRLVTVVDRKYVDDPSISEECRG
jgi:hypothetical protein